MSQPPDLWAKHVQQWRWLGSPLRPAAEDTQVAERCVQRWHDTARRPAPRAVVLGVTPEFARMRWPSGVRLIAVDHTPAMIHGIWLATGLGYPALCAEWRALPLAASSQDVVLGDGGFTTLPYPDGYRELAREIRRVLRGEGLLLVRFSVRPDVPEPPLSVFDDLKQGRIGNFHAFKWRLAMALQARPEEGVRLCDVYDAWHAAALSPEDLARQLSWPLPVILTINAYRGIQARHTFPTLAQTRAAVTAEFEEIACHFPGYELGERWPTLALRPR